MNHFDRRIGLPFIVLAVALSNLDNIQVSAQAVQGGTNRLDALDRDAIERLSRENYQRELLGFVSPHYRGSMLQEILVRGLNSDFKYGSAEGKVLADKAAKLGVDALRTEQQTRLLDLSEKIQRLEWIGTQSAVGKELNKTNIRVTKTMNENAKQDLMDAILETDKKKYEVGHERWVDQLKYKIQNAKDRAKNGFTNASGADLNILLESMIQDILNHRSIFERNKDFAAAIGELTIDPSDFAKIQLKFDVEGAPIVFSAADGSTALGKAPFSMRDPDIAAELSRIESQLVKLSKMKQDDPLFYAGVKSLPAMLDKLETVSLEKLGSDQAAAIKGEHAIWKIAKDYRRGLQSIAKRLELEGSPDIIQSRAKYDAAKHGNKLLPFLDFIISNGCRFAPAKAGDAPTYVKMLSLMMQFEAIIEE